MNFIPGDKAIFRKYPQSDGPSNPPAPPDGTVVIVLSGRLRDSVFVGGYGYEIDSGASRATCSEICLSPLPPQNERKREEVGDWDLCPWRPAKALIAVKEP